MTNIIKFAQTFSAYHARKGEPTYFIEQLLNNLSDQHIKYDVDQLNERMNIKLLPDFRTKCGSKGHTIRSGSEWEVGDIFYPGIWLGNPNESNFIIFEPSIKIKKIWTFDCDENGEVKVDGYPIREEEKIKMAKNDGLSLSDFEEWLVVPCINAKKRFKGQVICWDDAIEYNLG